MESSDSENSSVEEIEDTGDGFTAEDDMFVDLVQSERLQPLSELYWYLIIIISTQGAIK